MAIQAEELRAAGYPFCDTCDGAGVISYHDCGDDTCGCSDISDNITVHCPVCLGKRVE